MGTTSFVRITFCPILLVLFAFLTAACTGKQAKPLASVSDFDLDRYLGEWHQVAAIPAWFQEDCLANTRANYSRAEDNLLRVVNSCDIEGGKRRQAEARARFLAEPNQGKLEVTFVDVLGYWLWPAAGDYWIMALDEHYHWSLVGEPGRRYAWVLARDPFLDKETLIEIGRVLEEENYDPCALVMTDGQSEGRLCDAVR